MNTYDFAVTFACYNQVEYTRRCIDSMVQHGLDLRHLVIVDNGSVDDTRAYLQSLPLGGCIFNKMNLGCGVAWNQGALALQAEWTIIMNNDVLVSDQWIEKLISTAERNNLKVLSPALIEGDLDYDFPSLSSEASGKMKCVFRTGDYHAVCFAVHESVWLDVGYFRPVPKLFGYEDTLFYHELQKADISFAITGASWLHHFGSITQNAMKRERGLSQKDDLGYKYNYRLLHLSWFERKLKKWHHNRQRNRWRNSEVARYGMSLMGVRRRGEFRWG